MKNIKIKCQPEDFLVEEITDIAMSASGQYAIYKLRKTGWNTLDALRRISRDTRIPYNQFAYGGKKDRFAQTMQYISVYQQNKLSIKEKDYSMEFVGYSAEPMSPLLITSNRFRVVVRDLSDTSGAISRIEHIRQYGLPNYFDDQRFDSYDPRHGFLGEKVIKRHWNGALKAYLLSWSESDRATDKNKKHALEQAWGDWPACLTLATDNTERQVFQHLITHPRGHHETVKRLPPEELTMAFSAYQSYIWNELLRRLLVTRSIATPLTYTGKTGAYLFYEDISAERFADFSSLQLPTMAADTRMPDTTTQHLYDKLLQEQELTGSLLHRLKIRTAYLRGYTRPALLIPADLTAQSCSDELYRGKQKLILNFTLPRGAYATMIIKRLFAD